VFFYLGLVVALMSPAVQPFGLKKVLLIDSKG